MLVRYLANLNTPRLILWCYLIWYLNVAVTYFEATPRLWLNSLGLSVVIAVALISNATSGGGRIAFWPAFRFFIIPFCVSSFAALIKSQGFLLIFSQELRVNALGAGLCAGFCLLVAASRAMSRRPAG